MAMADKENFRAENITGNKDHFIKIKGLMHQKDVIP